ncbi:MAG: hypothetical protein R3F59_19960 [Myxococcota bacterium]
MAADDPADLELSSDALAALERLADPDEALAARAAALRLARAGVDPRHLLDRALPVVAPIARAHRQPLAAWLAPIVRHLLALEAAGIGSWSSTAFGLDGMAAAAVGDVALFGRHLDRLAELLLRAQARGVSLVRLHQYAMRAWCEAVGAPAVGARRRLRPWPSPSSTPAATPAGCSRSRCRPGGRASPTSPRATPGRASRRRSPRRRSASRRRGRACTSATRWRRASRPSAPTARAARAPARLARPAPAVIRSVLGRGGSPYGALEYALPQLALPWRVPADALTGVLELGVVLSDRGIEPGPTWGEGLAALDAGFSVDDVIGVATRCARAGADPHLLLSRALPAASPAQLAPLEALTTGLAARALPLRKTLEDGVPYLLRALADRPDDFAAALAAAQGLVAQGIAPGASLSPGLQPALEGGAPPWALRGFLEAMAPLGAAGVDPYPTLTYGLPTLLDAAGGDPATFARLRDLAVALVVRLEAAHADSGRLLYGGVRDLHRLGGGGLELHRLLQRVGEVFDAVDAAGGALGGIREGLDALLRAAQGGAWVVDAGLDVALALARRGVDPGPLLAAGAAPALRIAGDDPRRFRSVLTDLAAAGVPVDVLGPVAAAAAVLAEGDPARLQPALALGAAAWRGRARVARRPRRRAFEPLADLAGGATSAPGRPPSRPPGASSLALQAAGRRRTTLWAASRALPAAPAARRPTWGRRSPRWASWSARWRCPCAAGSSRACALRRGRPRATRRASPLRWRPSARPPARSPPTPSGRRSCSSAAPAPPRPRPAAGRRRGRAVVTLATQLGAEPLRAPRRASPWRSAAASRCSASPAAGARVVRPVLHTVGARSRPVLDALGRIDRRWLRGEADLDVLVFLVTQTGVRAVEWLRGLVVPGLASGVLEDLAAERETLERYVAALSFADPALYAAYRAIQRDPTLGPAEVAARTDALVAQFDALLGAVREGELAPGQERDRLLPLVLYHVFPPALSASRDRYLQLVHAMEDRPQDLERLEAGPLRRHRYDLRQGAWELRAEVDRTAWTEASEAAAARPEAAEEAAPLGWALLGRWAEGRLARPSVRRALLGRVAARAAAAGVEVPGAPDATPTLVAWREFLGDHVRDAVETALLAAREQDLRRYERLVRDRLAPTAEVGSGLVRAVWGLREQLLAGRVDRGTAAERLGGLLRGFDVPLEALVDELPAVGDAESLRALLGALPVREGAVPAGVEVARVLGDLCGEWLAAMQRELYGARGSRASSSTGCPTPRRR